jgi:hypothetical protein
VDRRILLAGSYLPGAVALGLGLTAGQLEVPEVARPAFDGDRAMARLRDLFSPLRARTRGSTAAARARERIEAALRACGLEPYRVRRGPEVAPLVSVLADRAGAAGAVLLLAAHYDSVPGSPGAVDNAAAVAALVEVACALAPRRDGPTLRFAFFDGEEDEMEGARLALDGWSPAERARLLAAVSLDDLGWRGGALVVHTFRRTFAGDAPRGPPGDLVAILLASARAAGVDLSVGDPLLGWPYQLAVRMARTPFGSDDAPFLAAGIPALFVSDSSLTRFYPEYHRGGDDLTHVSRERLAEVGRLVLATVDAFAAGARVRGTSDRYLVAAGRVLLDPWFTVVLALAAVPAAAAALLARRARRLALALLAALALGAALADPHAALAFAAPYAVLSPLCLARRRIVRAFAFVAVLGSLYAVSLLLGARLAFDVDLDLEGVPLAAGLAGAGSMLLAIASRGPREDARVR